MGSTPRAARRIRAIHWSFGRRDWVRSTATSDSGGSEGWASICRTFPLTLAWLGGVQAHVTVSRPVGMLRIGEDSDRIPVVPPNVPTGCAVPLAVQIGNEVSNYTVIASGIRRQPHLYTFEFDVSPATWFSK